MAFGQAGGQQVLEHRPQLAVVASRLGIPWAGHAPAPLRLGPFRLVPLRLGPFPLVPLRLVVKPTATLPPPQAAAPQYDPLISPSAAGVVAVVLAL
jgi:hypothetical protein